MRIYLIGFMGAGKTYWGKELSKKLQIPFFDLDELITHDTNKSIPEIFDEMGEEGFRVKEKEMLHLITGMHTSLVLSCGGGAPCFFNNIDYMNQNGVTVWLNTPQDILLGRLRRQQDKRPLLKGLDDEQLKTFIIKKAADRKMYYEKAKIKIQEREIKIEDFLKNIFHA